MLENGPVVVHEGPPLVKPTHQLPVPVTMKRCKGIRTKRPKGKETKDKSVKNQIKKEEDRAIKKKPIKEYIRDWKT